MDLQNTNEDAARYPVTTFKSAMQIAEAVRDEGGANMPVSKATLASRLNSSAASGAFMMRIGTARTYNLIEGRGSYRLTPLAMKYFFPTSEWDTLRAKLRMFSSPAVFAELIKRFDGSKVPSSVHLANTVRDLDVPESWKDRVASLFTNTAETLGILERDGFLRYRAQLDGVSREVPTGKTLVAAQPIQSLGQPASRPSGYTLSSSPKGDSATLGDDQCSVRIETSGPLSADVWRRLDRFVQILNPNPEGSKK